MAKSKATDAFVRGATADDIAEVAVKEGMLTLAADGIRHVAAGLTTVDEVMRTTSKW